MSQNKHGLKINDLLANILKITKLEKVTARLQLFAINVLGYRISLCFHDYEVAIEVDDNGAIEQKLGCKFVRIDPDKMDFKTINEIFRYIK